MEEYLIVFSKWIYRGVVRTTTFPFVRLSNDVAWMYIAACNATKLDAKYPQRHLKLFCCFCYYVCRVPYIHTVSCSIFVLALGFPFHECNNNFLKHSLMALSLCDTDSQAFTHIFFYFFHIFPVLVHSVSPVIFEASYLVSAATMLVWELVWYTVYGHSRRRHFVAKYSFDMRNI